MAVLTLALGIGLNSAVFSVVNALLFKPIPAAAPHELANVYTAEPDGFVTHAPMSFPDYEDLADARAQIGHFLDEVYQRKRIHSALGYLTPSEFEAAFFKEQNEAKHPP